MFPSFNTHNVIAIFVDLVLINMVVHFLKVLHYITLT